MTHSKKSSGGRSGFSRNAFCWPCLALISFSLVACGNVDHGNRTALKGIVLAADEPIEGNAMIYFDPVDSKGVIGGSAAAFNGAFNFSRENGPTPGKKYNVTVTTKPGIPKPGVPNSEQVAPKKFKGMVEVPEKVSGELTIDVELVP